MSLAIILLSSGWLIMKENHSNLSHLETHRIWRKHLKHTHWFLHRLLMMLAGLHQDTSYHLQATGHGAIADLRSDISVALCKSMAVHELCFKGPLASLYKDYSFILPASLISWVTDGITKLTGKEHRGLYKTEPLSRHIFASEQISPLEIYKIWRQHQEKYL